MNFFEQWDEAKWHFTIMDEEDLSQPVLQGGLIGTFFIEKSSARHAELAHLLKRYDDMFGQHFKWGTWGEPVRRREYSPDKLAETVRWCQVKPPSHPVEYTWCSSADFDFVGDWEIQACADSELAEINWPSKPIGYLRFYFPVELLKADGGAAFESWLLECATVLQPLNGYGGLGLQQCYEHDRYANLELELSEQFKGFDVGHPLGHAEMRDGFKSVNWYTVLRRDAVDSKLGGVKILRQKLEAAGLQLIEYPGGVIVKAGDFPSLGWVERDPLPAPYVLANHILKPARVPELYGLHYGSVMGEARFTNALSAQWACRFDVPDDQLPPPLPRLVETGPAMAVFALSGEPCPRTGVWSPRADVPLSDVILQQGRSMPWAEWRNSQGLYRRESIRWQWVAGTTPADN